MSSYKQLISEIPNMPLNVEVNTGSTVQQSVRTSQVMFYAFSVRWDVPDNIDRFDLEYFKVQAFIAEPGTGYFLNRTSTELEYQFNFLPLQSDVHITVTAVSKCSQQGPRSLQVVWMKNTGPGVVAFMANNQTGILTTSKDYDIMFNGMHYK